MKVIVLFAALLIYLSIVPYIDAREGEWNLELVFEIPVPDIMDTDAGALLLCSGWSPSGRIGSPLLPERTYHVPLGHSMVEMVSFQFFGEYLMRIDRPLRLSPPAGCGDRVIDRDEETKAPAVRITGMISGKGGSYAVIRLSPYSYTDGSLVFPEEVNVRMKVEPSIGRRTVRVTEDIPMVDRRDDSDAQLLWQEAPPAAQDTMPSTYYHNTTPPTKLVIITSSTYNSTFRPLSNWKTAKGVYTRVVETSWIYGKYSGTDNQEKIRKYLQDLYENEELEWVILGGDHDVVPARLAYVPDGYDDSGSDGSYVATDAYYSDLDGSGHSPYDWDGDNDGNFGEYSDDGIDLWPEVYVGRLSGNSVSELSAMVSNIIKYEKDPPTGSWFNRSVMAGAYSNYRRDSSSNDTTDEADLKEAIRLDFLGTAYNTTTLYEKAGIWPSQRSCDSNLTYNNMVSAIDEGAFMVNMAGHGSSTGIFRRIWNSDTNGNGLCDSGEYSDTSYYSSSASQSNGEKRPLFYNDACNNGEFDRVTNCLTEDILRDVGIGAVGSSRVSWYAVHWSKGTDGGFYNQGHDYRFWEQFFGSGDQQPGKALYLSKYDYINDKTAHNKYAWKNLLQYNLMGDPEIPIWTRSPSQLTVTYSNPTPSPGSLQVSVRDGSSNAVKDARVCVMNGTSFYSVAFTNSTGVATISFPSLLMDMNLTVTAMNFKPYLGVVSVGEDDEPPEINSISFAGNDTTGDPFEIYASVSDDAGIGYVNLHWNHSISTPASFHNTSMDLSPSGGYVLSGWNPVDSLQPLWFRVITSDIRGNVNTSSWRSVQIYDNDLPYFISDGSDTLATTGDPFVFSVLAMDNIGIKDAFVNYTLDGAVFHNVSLTGSGPFTMEIIMPDNVIGTLRYAFHVTDEEGNRNMTPVKAVTLADNDHPYMVQDLTSGSPSTGSKFTLALRPGDNVGVQHVRAEYSLAGGTSLNVSMGIAGQDRIFNVSIDPYETGPLDYRFMIADTSGNIHWTEAVELPVIDDDLPRLLSDLTWGNPTTGDPFAIRFSAEDNIGLEGCYVDHRIGTGPVMRNRANGTSGIFQFEIAVPSDASGNLTYRLIAVDTSGNENVTSFKQIMIIDDDIPEMISYRLLSGAFTGDDLELEFILSDNIGISSAHVEWKISGREGSVELSGPFGSGNGTFAASIPVPSDIVGAMAIKLRAFDPSGNELAEWLVDVPVLDNDIPELADIMFPEYATTGDPFVIEAELFDNMGVKHASALVEISGAVEELVMSRISGSFRAVVDVPGNATGELALYIRAIDLSENIFESALFNVEIIDDDAPVIVSTGGLGSSKLYTGDAFSVPIEASDNVGTPLVWLVLSAGGREIEVVSTGEGPIHIMSLVVWSDIVGEAMATVFARDGSGNEVNRSFALHIADNDVPMIEISCALPEVPLSGGCTIEASYSDNIGVELLSLHASKGSVNMTLQREGDGFIFVPTSEGEWNIFGSAIDPSGNVGYAYLTLNVIDDVPPDVEIAPVQEGAVGEPIRLEAVGEQAENVWTITDPNGKVTTVTGSVTDLIPTIPGTYNVKLISTDPNGNTAEIETSFHVANGDGTGDDILPFIIGGTALLLVLILAGIVIALVLFKKRKGSEQEGAPEKDVWEGEGDPWG